MNTGPFHQLHDSGHKNLVSITDRVNFHFLAANVFVNENGFICVDFHGGMQIIAQLDLIRNNLHSAPSQNKGGSHKNGIADLLCSRNTVLNARYGPAVRLRDVKLQQQLLKSIPVLCLFNGCAVRADDMNAKISQRLGEVNCGLTTQ